MSDLFPYHYPWCGSVDSMVLEAFDSLNETTRHKKIESFGSIISSKAYRDYNPVREFSYKLKRDLHPVTTDAPEIDRLLHGTRKCALVASEFFMDGIAQSQVWSAESSNHSTDYSSESLRVATFHLLFVRDNPLPLLKRVLKEALDLYKMNGKKKRQINLGPAEQTKRLFYLFVKLAHVCAQRGVMALCDLQNDILEIHGALHEYEAAGATDCDRYWKVKKAVGEIEPVARKERGFLETVLGESETLMNKFDSCKQASIDDIMTMDIRKTLVKKWEEEIFKSWENFFAATQEAWICLRSVDSQRYAISHKKTCIYRHEEEWPDVFHKDHFRYPWCDPVDTISLVAFQFLDHTTRQNSLKKVYSLIENEGTKQDNASIIFCHRILGHLNPHITHTSEVDQLLHGTYTFALAINIFDSIAIRSVLLRNRRKITDPLNTYSSEELKIALFHLSSLKNSPLPLILKIIKEAEYLSKMDGKKKNKLSLCHSERIKRVLFLYLKLANISSKLGMKEFHDLRNRISEVYKDLKNHHNRSPVGADSLCEIQSALEKFEGEIVKEMNFLDTVISESDVFMEKMAISRMEQIENATIEDARKILEKRWGPAMDQCSDKCNDTLVADYWNRNKQINE